MAFGIYNLFEAFLLMVNAVAVLHEQRFLDKIGWGRNQNQNNMNMNQFANVQGYGQVNQPGFKDNLIYLIHSVRTVMRPPLILLNIIVIVIKLIAG